MDDIGILLPQVALTAEEEVSLARQIEAGVIAAAVRRRQAFTGVRVLASETELIMIEQIGARAVRRFVEQNLRLVAMVSRKEAIRSRMSDADLFQEGCLGLLEAVRRFDHRRELRFATYALHWIRAYIGASTANRAGEVNLPASSAERIRGIRGVQSDLAQQLGRHASVAEIAAAVDRPAEWVARVLDFQPTHYLAHEQLTELDLIDPEASQALDRVLDGRVPGRELLAGLVTLQRRVIELRFGFADGVQHTYLETSHLLGVSLSTVRRTEARALERLREICPQQAGVHLAS